MKAKKTSALLVCIILTGSLLLSACGTQAPASTTAGVKPTVPSTTQPAATVPQQTLPPETTPRLSLEPDKVMNEMYDAGNAIVMTLFLADGQSVGPYSLLSVSSNLRGAWNGLSECQEPDVSACEEWLVLESADGTIRLTVYKGNPDVILYEKDGLERYYRGTGTERILRMVFDSVDNIACGRIAFACDGSGETVLKEYASTAYPQHLEQLAPGSANRFSDYAALSWTVTDQQENALSGVITFAAISPLGFSSMTNWLDMVEGTGEYEGWMIFSKDVALEKHSDGLWYEISGGDYNVVYNRDYGPKDVSQIDANAPQVQEAMAYLAQAREAFAQCQEAETVACLRGVSELFLRCTTAAAISGSTDFDWTVFCTRESLSLTGMRSLLKSRVNSQLGDGFLRGDLNGDISINEILVREDRAVVELNEIQIYFLQIDGIWQICDVVEPYAGT